MSIYFKLGAIFIAITIVSFLAYDYASIKKDLAIKKNDLLRANAVLEKQTKEIKQLEVDVEAYKKQKPKVVEKIVYRYKDYIVNDDRTCEEKLDSLNQLLNEFHSRREHVK